MPSIFKSSLVPGKEKSQRDPASFQGEHLPTRRAIGGRGRLFPTKTKKFSNGV